MCLSYSTEAYGQYTSSLLSNQERTQAGYEAGILMGKIMEKCITNLGVFIPMKTVLFNEVIVQSCYSIC